MASHCNSHKDGTENKKRALRACVACRRMKKKCSDTRPCERCVRNKRNCVDSDGTVFEYDAPPPSARSTSSTGGSKSSRDSSSSGDSSQNQQQNPMAPPPITVPSHSQYSGQNQNSMTFSATSGSNSSSFNNGTPFASPAVPNQHQYNNINMGYPPGGGAGGSNSASLPFPNNFSHQQQQQQNNYSSFFGQQQQQQFPPEMSIISELLQIRHQMQTMISCQTQNPFVMNFHNSESPAIMMRFSSKGLGKPRIITCNMASEKMLGSNGQDLLASYTDYYGFGADPMDDATKEHIHLIQQFISMKCDEGQRIVRIGNSFFQEKFVIKDRIFYCTYTPVSQWNDGLELYSNKVPLLTIHPTVSVNNMNDFTEQIVKKSVGRVYLQIYNLQQQRVAS